MYNSKSEPQIGSPVLEGYSSHRATDPFSTHKRTKRLLGDEIGGKEYLQGQQKYNREKASQKLTASLFERRRNRPEVTTPVKVLQAVEEKAPFKLNLVYGEAGFHCIEKYGTNLPQETIDLLKRTDACLKGPMTTPEEAGAPISAAVKIRKIFDLYANVRPCKTFPNVESLKPNLDFVVVRENTEGFMRVQSSKPPAGVGIAYRIITTKASQNSPTSPINWLRNAKNTSPTSTKATSSNH